MPRNRLKARWLAALTPLALGALFALATTAPTAQADANGRAAELFESSFAQEGAGNTDRALNDVLKILRTDKDNYVANLRAGWLYYLKGRFADAIAMYDKARDLQPRAIEPKLGVMLPMMAARKWAPAEAVGKEILEKAPRNYLAMSRLAYIAYSQGRYKDAEERYRAVLEDYPSDVEMMLGLGWTYLKEGRSSEARAMFQAVLSIRRDNLSAQSGLQSL